MGSLFFDLTFGLFDKLISFTDKVIEFLFMEINIPVFIAIPGQNSVQWISTQPIDIISTSAITFLLLSWLIQKIAPIL